MALTESQHDHRQAPPAPQSARRRYGGPLAISTGLIAIVLLMRLSINLHGSFPADGFAVRHFSTPWSTESNTVQTLTGFFSGLGTSFIATPLVVLTALGLWRRGDRIAVEGLVVACLAIIANALMKVIFGPTPDWVAAHHTGSNFPSGHTTFFTAVIGYLAVIAWRRGQREVAVGLALLVILGGPSRVIAGAHLVGDVIAGYCFGAAFLIAALTWVRWRSDQVGTEPPR